MSESSSNDTASAASGSAEQARGEPTRAESPGAAERPSEPSESGAVGAVSNPSVASPSTAGDASASKPSIASASTPGIAAASSSNAEALVGSVLAERYRVDKLLGSGGMGSVYRAHHVHMRKAVAIKVLHREMTFLPEIVARFEREAVAAARIEHPNVAAATDFGRLEDQSFYLVLEYVEGRSLRSLMKERKRLPAVRALHITQQIANALGAAHAAGIIHRDLKPDNVMLVERDGDSDFVKVLDFGIAKVNVGDSVGNQPLTQMGTVFGTPEYMSPEQAQGLEVDARADLYTLGILLYEMLAGKTPFHDDDLIVVLTRQLTMDPPPLPSDVDSNVAALTMQLLDKAPDARPQTAADVSARIDALLGTSPSPSGGTAPRSSVVAGAAQPSSAQSEVGFSETVLSVQKPDLGQYAATSPGAPPSSGRLVRNTMTAVSERVVPAVRRLRPLLERYEPQLKRVVDIRGRKVVLWKLIAIGGALIAVIVVFVSIFSGPKPLAPTASASAAAPVAQPDEDVSEIVERAEKGDRAALAELTARPESKRTAAEWHAIGRGQLQAGQYVSSVAAYKRAAALDKKLASDPTLLQDVREAVEKSESQQAALDLAADGLGASGVDLLFDVWDSYKKSPNQATLAKSAKQYLDDADIRSQASRALRVALDLSNAKTCSDYKALLPRALADADERSASKLKGLQSRGGCGFLGFGDCYPCLRGKDVLVSVSDALKSAQSRPGPRFRPLLRSEQ